MRLDDAANSTVNVASNMNLAGSKTMTISPATGCR